MEREKTLIDSPFVGPFPIPTKSLIYGRDQEMRMLVNLLISKRIVLLHSPSGAGKSSLINAGLLPALEDEEMRVLETIRVNQEIPALSGRPTNAPPPNRYVMSTLLSLDADLGWPDRMAQSDLADLADLVDQAGKPDLGICEYLARRVKQTQATGQAAQEEQPMVLIFDQFEEVLTSSPIDLEEKKAFFRDLGAALKNPMLWALFAMREDYVGRLDPYLPLIPGQLSVRMRLDLLSQESAVEAIRRPSPPSTRRHRAGVEDSGITNIFTESAASALAKDLAQIQIQQPNGKCLSVTGPFVEPVQLQVVCLRLWNKRPAGANTVEDSAVIIPGASTVEGECYDSSAAQTGDQPTSTVDEALSGYYDEVIARLMQAPQGAETGDRMLEWRIRDWFEHKLITAQGIRNQVMRGVDQSEGLENELIQGLIKAYLVREEPRRGVTWYELAHDRLVRPIRTANARWKSKNQLLDRAARWAASGRRADLLLNEADLKEMRQWEQAHLGSLTFEEEDLLQSSTDALLAARKITYEEYERRTNLAVSGWGVIFSDRAGPEQREALKELLDLRKLQAGDRYKEFQFISDPPETAWKFLVRYGIPTSAPDPKTAPHYLLIVGDPQSIPFEFQYDLDLLFSVGRIHFDQLEDYRTYAHSVVLAERGQANRPRQVAIFAPQHEGDMATQVLAKSVLDPMIERLKAARMDALWEFKAYQHEQAYKRHLRDLLGGPDMPALLMTFTHSARPDAFLCQDWPGLQSKVQDAYYFTLDDIRPDARLLGSVAFLWAGPAAGSAAQDDFAFTRGRQAKPQQPVVSELARRLLAHPNGGAQAVIGHVGTNWLTEGGAGIMNALTEFTRRLMSGYTVGTAIECFKERRTIFAARASEIVLNSLQKRDLSQLNQDAELNALFLAMVDTRNYIVLGDPAVRLRVKKDGAQEVVEFHELSALPAGDKPGYRVHISSGSGIVIGDSGVVIGQNASVIINYQAAPREDYADLEISLRRQGEETYQAAFRLVLPNSDASYSSEAELANFNPLELRALAERPTQFGEQLFISLFGQPEARSIYQQAMSSATTIGIPLRVRLLISPDAQELYSLAWEMLKDPATRTPLAGSQNVYFTRYLSSLDFRPIRIKPVERLRALVVISCPSNVDPSQFAPIDPVVELERARKALGDIEIAALAGGGQASLAGLMDALNRSPAGEGIDILYLVAHQVYSLVHGEEAILLEKADGTGDLVRASTLANQMQNLLTPPLLAVLVSGKSAEPGSMVTLGPKLAQSGISAVLAIQGSASFPAFDAFLAAFFHELTRDGQVDRAVAAARSYVRDQPGWLTPVLFTRLRSGRAFLPARQETAAALAPAPFMAPPRLAEYVQRGAELHEITGQLLEMHGSGGILALVGIGGSGKTTLASAACYDAQVKAAFTGGILWVTLGDINSMTELIGKLDGLTQVLTGESPRSLSIEAAAQTWQQAAGQAAAGPLLLVIDDVWKQPDVEPFLRGAPRCTRLVTTRNQDALPPSANRIYIDNLTPEQSLALLCREIEIPPTDRDSLLKLVDRMGHWPLLLGLANGVLRQQIAYGQPLSEAARYLERTLDRRGLAAFDMRDPVERNQSVRTSIEASLDKQKPQDQNRLTELAIFPEGIEIPLEMVKILWKASGGLDSLYVEALCRHLFRASLLSRYDLSERVVTLHPLIRAYLLERNEEKIAAIHAQFLDACRASAGLAPWSAQAEKSPYLLSWLGYHLQGAQRAAELKNLLFDLDWLETKVSLAGLAAVLDDFALLPRDADVQILRETLLLSRHALFANTTNVGQVSGQIAGRLAYLQNEPFKGLVERARRHAGLVPLLQSLAAPGGVLGMILVGHNAPVYGVAVSPDSRWAVSGSDDRTLRIWDLANGRERVILKGHHGRVNAVAITPDAQHIISASDDGTLKVWDAAGGQVVRTMIGHTGGVRAVAVTPDARLAISGGEDTKVRVWDIASGQERFTLSGHTGWVRALAVSPDGKMVVSAGDEMRFWDLSSGELLPSPRELSGQVRSVAITPDGKAMVEAIDVDRVEVWIQKSTHVRKIATGWAMMVAITADGRFAVTGTWDGRVVINELKTGRETANLCLHAGPIYSLAVSPDARLALTGSQDGLLKVIDLNRALEQGRDTPLPALNGLSFAKDGRALYATGEDAILNWDTSTGQLCQQKAPGLRGLLAMGGEKAVTFFDNRLTVWDLASGETVRSNNWGILEKVRLSTASRDGRWIVEIDERDYFLAYDFTEQAFKQTPWRQKMVKPAGTSVAALWISEDGKVITCQWTNGRVSSWNRNPIAMKGVYHLPGPHNTADCVALSANGSRALTGAEDGSLRLHDLLNRKLVHVLQGHTNQVTAVAITPDGQYGVSAGSDLGVCLWDLVSGTLMARFTVDFACQHAAIDDGGRLVAASDVRGLVHLLCYNQKGG